MACEEKPAQPVAPPRAAALDRAEAALTRATRRVRVPDRALLPVFLAAGAAASVALGIDRNWDLLNYRLHNPLALLADRSGDVAPPGAQVFFNPAADLPFFGLLRGSNEHPPAVAALMGLPAGVALGPSAPRTALPGRGAARPPRRGAAAATRRADGLLRRGGPGGNAVHQPHRPGAVRRVQSLRGAAARSVGRSAAHLRPGAGTRRRRGSGRAARPAPRRLLLPAGLHQRTSGGLGPLVCPAARAEGDAFPPAPTHGGLRANTLGGRRGPRLHSEGALLWPPAGCRRPRITTERGAVPRLMADVGIERAEGSEAVLTPATGGDGSLALRSRAGSFHLQGAECLD